MPTDLTDAAIRGTRWVNAATGREIVVTGRSHRWVWATCLTTGRERRVLATSFHADAVWRGRPRRTGYVPCPDCTEDTPDSPPDRSNA